MENLHPKVEMSLQSHTDSARTECPKGILPNFTKGDYVLMDREDFNSGETLNLRWRGPKRIINAIDNYVYQVEDLGKGQFEDIHASRLKFYLDCDILFAPP